MDPFVCLSLLQRPLWISQPGVAGSDPFLGAAQGPVIILVSRKSSLEPAKGNGYVAAAKQAQPKGQDKSALNMPNSIVAFVENNRYLCVVDKS